MRGPIQLTVSSSAVRTYQATVAGYVDVHAHVLPGIDDGPSDADGALAMLRAAAASGIGTIAVTPHLRPDFPDVQPTELARRADELREAGEMAGIEIRVVSGAEVSLAWALEASDEELALATYDQGGTDLLIETPTYNVVGLDSLLWRLRAKGLRVTLAHPERSVPFQRDPAPLVELVRQGVLLQVNADALITGPRRSDTQRLGRYLCLEGLAHALASDGHRASRWRAVTRLADAAQEAARLIGADRAHWMTQIAPAAILTGAALPEAPPPRVGRRMHKLLRRR
jgi:protein-tyrosine phosphatase